MTRFYDIFQINQNISILEFLQSHNKQLKGQLQTIEMDVTY